MTAETASAAPLHLMSVAVTSTAWFGSVSWRQCFLCATRVQTTAPPSSRTTKVFDWLETIFNTVPRTPKAAVGVDRT